jgi:hypothetical protein
MTTNQLNVPDDLSDEYRMASEENIELLQDYSDVDVKGWEDEY